MDKKTTFEECPQFVGGQDYEILKSAFFSLIKGKKMQDIFDYTYMLLGNSPHLVRDGSLLCAPRNSKFSNSSFLDMLRNTTPVCHEAIYILTTQQFMELAERSASPILVDCAHLGLRLMSICIRYKGSVVAGLTLPESEKTFGESDGLYLQLLAEYITESLSDENSDIYNAMFFRNHFKRLLEGETELDISLNIPPALRGRQMFIACVKVPEPEQVEFEELHQGGTRGLHFCRSIIHEDYVVYLCIPENETQDAAIKDFFASISSEGYLVGISSTFSLCKKIPSHFLQAKKMAELGEKYCAETVRDFHDHLTTAFLYEASEHIQLGNYLDSSFLSLQKTDSEKGTDYLNTLLTYFECSTSKQETCKQLELHRNTLANRLGRIESILDASLNPDENVFYYLLMYKLVEVCNSLGGQKWT